MKRKQIWGLFFFLLLTLLAACAPVAPPAPAPAASQAPAAAPLPAPAPVAAPAAKPAWQTQWEDTVEAAKKEDTLVMLTSNGPELTRAVGRAFKSTFGISIEWIAATTGELGVRVVNERRAKIYSADAGLMGYVVPITVLKQSGALESFDNVLFLPELTNPQEIQKTWRHKELWWVGKDHTILGFAPRAIITMMVNTNAVKPGEIKGFRDLLNPRWKGNIVLHDPTLGTGEGFDWFRGVGSVMGWDYMRQLANQQPLVTRDRLLVGDWVARGKYAIAIGVKGELIKQFMDVGAPVDRLLPEEGSYVNSGSAYINLINRPPHPNATKLFVNWLLSKDGQTVFCKALGAPSGRVDVPAEGVLSLMIINPEKKYVRIDTEEALLSQDEALKLAREIFGSSTK